ncbi:tetratricopeptide repeat protein [Bacillus altitudinis]|uniref:response regulator aspartate phosphatase n=1 Tax=Bacillus altitudinis TaxID=293387 RepID=UPI0039BFA8C6
MSVMPEVVSNTLNELHLAIKKCDVESAKKLFEKSKYLLNDMEENDKIIIYFQLLSSRYKMMLYKTRGESLPKGDWKITEDSLDDDTNSLIDYYFYLFETEYLAYLNNYETAIETMKVAEKKLEMVHSDIETAEFYVRAASLYMSIHQSIASLSYINEAINVYKKQEDYKLSLARSYTIKAMNYTHLKRYDDAEEFFLKSIKIAKELNDVYYEAMQCHNISLMYSNRGYHEDCINALQRAIRCREWRDSVYYINSLYMIVKERFIQGNHNGALYYLRKAERVLNALPNPTYEAKINIVRSIFCDEIKESLDKCRENIRYLEKSGDLDGVFDLSLLIKGQYEKKENFKEALEFANLAISTKEKMMMLRGV